MLAVEKSAHDFVKLGGLLKATPHQEGDERILYFEASNEDVDYQGEVVLQKALAESAAYFLRYGNIDLSHYTILGPNSGIQHWEEYEIGKPVDACVDGSRTFVKAQLYRGDSVMARKANTVWESLTKQVPPSRWYPSVGGAVLDSDPRINPETGIHVRAITKVRWNNIGLDRCPVNLTVPEVSTVPTAVFAKSLGAFVYTKSLDAGYGTDMATLAGGGALRTQSLEPRLVQIIPGNYFDFREALSRALLEGAVEKPNAARLVEYAATTWGLSHDEASEWVTRYMSDIKSNRNKR